MKIVAISDTHGKHLELTDMPKADVVIHSGDMSMIGSKSQIYNFLEWFSKLPYKHRILIPGNHDFFFDYDWQARTPMGKARFEGRYSKMHSKEDVEETIASFPEITYLNDRGVEIDGIKIYGSGVTPWFHDWAFNRMRGDEIKFHWDKIPADTDVLVTHGPVYKVLDRTIGGDLTGCEDLLEKIIKTDIKFHICGHIHEGYGTYETGDGRTFINASVLNQDYILTNKPIVFEINK